MTQGLERVAGLTPGGGFASVEAGLALVPGLPAAWMARGEVGWRPRAGVDLFGFAEAESVAGVTAGLGARVTW